MSRLKRRGLRALAAVALAIVAGAATTVILAPRVMAVNCFPDVLDSNIFHDVICFVQSAAIATGFPDGTYRPNDFVTRGQMAAFLRNTAALNRAAFFNNEGGVTLTNSPVTPIASLTMTTAARCVLLMTGTLDWDDNGTTGILFIQWYVDGNPIGGVFADQDDAAGESNDSLTAVAGAVLAPGTHSVQLRANTVNTASIESIGAHALCVPFDGNGNPAGPESAEPSVESGATDPGDPTQ